MKLINWIHNWIYLCFSFFTDKILKDFDECLLTGMILIDLKKKFQKINMEIIFFFKKQKTKSNHTHGFLWRMHCMVSLIVSFWKNIFLIIEK